MGNMVDICATLRAAIKEIQEKACLNCKFGKAIVTLDDMARRETPPVDSNPDPAKAETKPAAIKNSQGAKKQPGGIIKICKHCHDLKPLSEFPKQPGCKDGTQGTCKKCKSAQAKELREKRAAAEPRAPVEIADINLTHPHKCDKCGERFKTLNYLYEHKKERH